MKTLDFIIIGAQKAGTTTLFEHLSKSPDIYMPAGKEVPFFTQDDMYDAGFDAYLKEFFGSVDIAKKWGTATPHYLNDPRAADRIKKQLPNVKLIVILREPADRALSHYRMSVRRGIENRSFEQAIIEMLTEENLQEARVMPTGVASEASTYVVWGEYGRLLQPYLERYPRENILILFNDDLAADPEKVIKRICEFIGVPAFASADFGKRFHEGGTRERFPFLRKLRTIPIVRGVWRAIPQKIRARVLFWIQHKTLIAEKDSLDNYSTDVVDELRKHFDVDLSLLEASTGTQPSWLNK